MIISPWKLFVVLVLSVLPAPPLSSDSQASLDGSTIVLTGATSGIGRALAQHLLSPQHENVTLLVGVRPGEEMDVEVMEGETSRRVLTWPLDLADGASTAAFAAQVRAYCEEHKVHIDRLVNNAGTMHVHATATRGEMVRVNARGAVQLHLALKDLMDAKDGRVVYVTSAMQLMGSLHVESGQYAKAVRDEQPVGSVWRALMGYADSKQAQTMASMALNGTEGLCTVAVHPGIVDTGLYADTHGWLSWPPWLMRHMRIMMTASQGAHSVMHALVGDGTRVCGHYLDRGAVFPLDTHMATLYKARGREIVAHVASWVHDMSTGG